MSNGIHECRLDGPSKQIPKKRAIAMGRPPTWSEIILKKEIEELKLQGSGDQEECMRKEAKLAQQKQELDDSIHYGLGIYISPVCFIVFLLGSVHLWIAFVWILFMAAIVESPGGFKHRANRFSVCLALAS